MNPQLCAARGMLGMFLIPCFCSAQQSGSVDASFDPGTGTDASVLALAIQQNNKIVIGGEFTSFNDTPRSRLARLNSNGSLDTDFDIGSGADGTVVTLALQPDDKIVIGGDFTSFNQQPRLRIARLNPDGSLDPSFNPKAALNGRVGALALDSARRILVAGNFTEFSGVALDRFLRLNPDGSLDEDFSPGIFPDKRVPSLAVAAEDRVWINALFDFGELGLVLMNADGSRAPSVYSGYFLTAGTRTINAIVPAPDGRVYAVGSFTAIGDSIASVGRQRVARLNPDSSLDDDFDTSKGPNAFVTSLALQPDGLLLIGGNFTSVAGKTANRVARLFGNGTLDQSFNAGSGPDATVTATALQTGGNLLIAGRFTTVDQKPRRGVARLLVAPTPQTAPTFTTVPASQTKYEGMEVIFTSWAEGYPAPRYEWHFKGQPIVGGTSRTLLLRDLRLTDGGEYTVTVSNSAGSISAPATLTMLPARISPGSVDISFATPFKEYAHIYQAALQGDGKILAVPGGLADGKTFSSVVVRFNPDGSLDERYHGPEERLLVPNTILPLPDGKALLGRWNGVTRLNADGSIDPTFTTLSLHQGSVPALALQADGKIVIGGGFNTVELVPYPYLARLNADGTLDEAFKPGEGPDGAVGQVVLQPDGRILIGGSFLRVDNHARKGLARLNSAGTLDPSFDPARANARGGLGALQPDGRILIVGTASSGTTTRQGLFRLYADGALDESFRTEFKAGESAIGLLLQADGKLVILVYRMGIIPRGHYRIARLNPDGSADTSFNSGPELDEPIYMLKLQPDGRILFAGSLRHVDSYNRLGLVRLLGDLRAFSPRRDGAGFALSIATLLGRNHVLEFRDSLISGEWQPLRAVAGDGTVKNLVDPEASAARRFYRVRVE